MEEIWKDIPFCKNYYEVSNLGRIRSKFRRYWKPDPCMKAGYAQAKIDLGL